MALDSAQRGEPLRVGADGDAVAELRRQRVAEAARAVGGRECFGARGSVAARTTLQCWRYGIVADTKSVCPAPRLSSPPSPARSAPESRSWSSARVRVSARRVDLDDEEAQVGGGQPPRADRRVDPLDVADDDLRRLREQPARRRLARAVEQRHHVQPLRLPPRPPRHGVTCAASSRVGSSTSACTVACGRSARRSGSTYASCLPRPRLRLDDRVGAVEQGWVCSCSNAVGAANPSAAARAVSHSGSRSSYYGGAAQQRRGAQFYELRRHGRRTRRRRPDGELAMSRVEGERRRRRDRASAERAHVPRPEEDMASDEMKSEASEAKRRRYDRQLRLWGAHGQEAMEECSVCLLNGSAVGTGRSRTSAPGDRLVHRRRRAHRRARTSGPTSSSTRRRSASRAPSASRRCCASSTSTWRAVRERGHRRRPRGAARLPHALHARDRDAAPRARAQARRRAPRRARSRSSSRRRTASWGTSG